MRRPCGHGRICTRSTAEALPAPVRFYSTVVKYESACVFEQAMNNAKYPAGWDFRKIQHRGKSVSADGFEQTVKNGPCRELYRPQRRSFLFIPRKAAQKIVVPRKAHSSGTPPPGIRLTSGGAAGGFCYGAAACCLSVDPPGAVARAIWGPQIPHQCKI